MREYTRWLARRLAWLYVFIKKYKYICGIVGFALMLFIFFLLCIFPTKWRAHKAGELIWEDMLHIERADEQYLEDWLYVMVDAGHGGKDPGALYNEIYEKDITLSVAKKVEALLELHKVRVIMVRDKDIFVNKYDRAIMANKKGVDLFISIHVNDLKQKSHYGIETYYGPGEADGRSFAHCVHNAALKNVLTADLGVKSAGYVVVKYTAMPSALIEIGFMSNERERDKLQSEGYQEMLAEGIVNGILDYAKTYMDREEP